MKRQGIFAVLLWVIIAVPFGGAQTPSATSQKPLTRAQILALLAGDVPSSRVAMLVQQRGIDFPANETFVAQVRKGGGDDDLVGTLQSLEKNASAPPDSASAAPVSASARPAPTTAPPDGKEEAMQEELAQDAARGAELLQNHKDAEAETAYRAAIKLDPQNAYFHMALARALNAQKKPDEAITEARLAVRLNPDSDSAHFCLANTMRFKEDYPGAIAEYQETVKLNPKFDMAYNNWGLALEKKGDADGAIAQFRQALSLRPRNEIAGLNLGNALENKGDLDGALDTYQKLVRERPRVAMAHFRLGQVLQKKGEPRKAANQFRIASNLAPQNRMFKEASDKASGNQ